MPFKGNLKRNMPVQILVSAGVNSGQVGTSLQRVVKLPLFQNSEITEFDLFTTQPATSSQQISTFGNNITRILIAVYLPPGGTAVLRVQQGVILHEDEVNDDATFVYDVVP